METTFYKRSYIFIAALFLAMALFLFAGCRGSKVETGYPEFIGIQPNSKTMVKLDSLAKVYPDLAPYLEYEQGIVTTKGTGKAVARKVKDQRHITININSGNKDKSTVKDKAETVIKDKSKVKETAKGGGVIAGDSSINSTAGKNAVQGDGNTVTPPSKVGNVVLFVVLAGALVGAGFWLLRKFV